MELEPSWERVYENLSTPFGWDFKSWAHKAIGSMFSHLRGHKSLHDVMLTAIPDCVQLYANGIA